MLSAIQRQTQNLPRNWMPRVVQFVPRQSATHILVRGYVETTEGRKGDRTFLFSLDKCQQVAEVAKIGTTSTHNGARV